MCIRDRLDWIYTRVKKQDRTYHLNFILLGDLNLDFDDPIEDRKEIEGFIKLIDQEFLKSKRAARVNFPFFDAHPVRGADWLLDDGTPGPFRTNARLDQTYDQIGLFVHDKRLPNHTTNARAGEVEGGFDYGMFDFVRLFLDALHGTDATINTLSRTQRSRFFAKFEHDFSDHMPIWIRLPKPRPGM